MDIDKKYFENYFKSFEKRFDRKLNKKLDEKFDKKLAKFATKADLIQEIDSLENKFATKDDLFAQTLELKTFSENQTETLARIIAATVVEPMERHFESFNPSDDIDVRVAHLERDMKRVKKSLLAD